jgi:hypothetical protein
MNDVIPLVNHAFAQMKLIFGRKYSSRFSTDKEVNATKRMWAIAFKQQRLSTEQITGAVEEIINNRLEWPPELPEFLKLCDQAYSQKLPTFDDVLSAIILRQGKHHTQKDYKFACQLIGVINQRCGHHMHTENSPAFTKRVKAEYQKAVFEHKTGTLPQVVVALPPPKLPAASDGWQPQHPQSAFMQRLKSVGKLFKGDQA